MIRSRNLAAAEEAGRALQGLRILVPESRELDLFSKMLEAEAAQVLRCPLVQILDVEDAAEARAWIALLIGGEFEDVIWLTGEGIRRLVALAEREGCREALVQALGRVRSITRGPKPARALRELGLAPDLPALAPTSQGVLDALAPEDIAERRIGLQLYPGDGGIALSTALRTRGAKVFPVTPYRYAAQADPAQVADAIGKIMRGEIDMVAFTSSPQIDRLFEVAGETGHEQELVTALNGIHVAAIGPVVEESLRRRGVTPASRPKTSFHLKPLVQEIIASRKRAASKHN